MTSPMLAPVPGAAFDAFLDASAPADLGRPMWTPTDGPLPSLFLGPVSRPGVSLDGHAFRRPNDTGRSRLACPEDIFILFGSVATCIWQLAIDRMTLLD